MPVEQENLTPFYRGWEEYQRLLIDALRPLTAEQLAIDASVDERPIWYLVAHIIGARIGWFQGLMGEGDPSLAELDVWDVDGAPQRSAAELIDGLERTWAMIADCLKRWTPANLEDIFTRERPSGQVQRTRGWVIWHVLEHDIHHGGEISLTLGNHGLAAPDL
jgi:uncharacterized damage-inducible protein DinB